MPGQGQKIERYGLLEHLRKSLNCWIMKDFPVPAEPVKKKNGYCLFVLEPITFVRMFIILYCSGGKLMARLGDKGGGSFLSLSS